MSPWIPAFAGMTASYLFRKRFALGIERGFAFEAQARKFGQRDVAVLHFDAIGKTAEGLEQARIILVAAEAQARRDVGRHLMAAMRDATRGRPAADIQHFLGAE